MAAPDFTISDVLLWARTKPAGEEYDYTDNGNCAMCQFLRETNRAQNPSVIPRAWRDGGSRYNHFSEKMNAPLRPNSGDTDSSTHSTFGHLVGRLEKLCPETVVRPSNWTRLDAYLTETVSV